MRTTLLLAVAGFALSSAAQAQVTVRTWPDSGNFEVSQIADSCAAYGDFAFDGRSDVRFILNYKGEEVLLSFSSTGWTSVDGQDVDLTYHFVGPDTAFAGSATGFTTSHIYHGFVARFGPDVLEAFARANSLMVMKGDTVITHINLRGSSAATASLRSCFTYLSGEIEREARRRARWDYIAPDPFAPVAGAPSASATPAVITNPSWARAPSADFPERAQSRGIREGSVDLTCTVNPNGSLSSCSVVAETPAGAGFGSAALAAARRARVSPNAVDSAGAAARTQFTVPFRLPE